MLVEDRLNLLARLGVREPLKEVLVKWSMSVS